MGAICADPSFALKAFASVVLVCVPGQCPAAQGPLGRIAGLCARGVAVCAGAAAARSGSRMLDGTVDGVLVHAQPWICAAVRCDLMIFFPTMKLQPLQLPKIVGSGRVTYRRALFSCVLPCTSIT